MTLRKGGAIPLLLYENFIFARSTKERPFHPTWTTTDLTQPQNGKFAVKGVWHLKHLSLLSKFCSTSGEPFSYHHWPTSSFKLYLLYFQLQGIQCVLKAVFIIEISKIWNIYFTLT